MVVSTPLPSIEEQIKALPSDALYEIVDGEVVEIEHMGFLASTIASLLLSYINNFALPRRLGVGVSEGLYRFRPDLPQLRPDISFIPASQWPANLTADSDPPALETVPSLAVEVISPSNTAAEIEKKREVYFEAGVIAVWVVYPTSQSIHVYDSPNTSRVVRGNDILDGGKAIPSFQVKVAEIFQCMFPAPKPTNGAS